MLKDIITKMLEDNRNAYHAHRAKVEKRAIELNAGWAKSRFGRDYLDAVVAPTWGKDDRPHAPFDGYIWENELGEAEVYGGGQYLPYVTELDRFDKPEYTGDHGWWKLRLTAGMFAEISEIDCIEIRMPYKTWEIGDKKAYMCQVRAHVNILKAIQDYSQEWFNAYYEELNKNKGEAPSGKQVVKGNVVSVKDWMSEFGPVFKMTVRLENGATVYGSLPKAVHPDYRGEIEFKADFTQAMNDSTHSFFKRPSSVKVNA